MISKIAKIALGLVFIGSSVFAQSLDDAKKAIDAEQYQKAKSMLKNLVVTQGTKDENFFYLGWVYLIQDYPDSAKEQFMKGIAVNPKSALNYVGLGAIAHYDKDAAGTTSNFDKALNFTSKRDSKPFLFMGQAYLLLPPGEKAVTANDATAAIAVLNKGVTANPKDVEVLVELGNVSRSQRNTTDAYNNYSNALTLDPKSLTANVAEGILWENAQNFEDAEKQFKAALAIDPNFGPAYREWAETDLYWSQTVVRTNTPLAQQKVKEAVDHYQKFLSLTDNSTESLLRYALFLYNAGDFTTLQDVAATLAKSANSNALVYRYIGYSAYHNKDYQNGLNAMNTWFSKAAPTRIIPADYLMLGRLQIASGKDTAKGVDNLKKYAELDTTKTEEIYTDLVNIYKSKKDYAAVIKTLQEEISKIHGRPLFTEHLYIGIYSWQAFHAQVRAAKINPAIKPDSSFLAVGDSALSFVQKNNQHPVYYTAQYRARIAEDKDADIAHMQGLAKPQYELVIKIIGETDSTKWTTSEKNALADAYDYEGNYSFWHDKDTPKAEAYYTKALSYNPTSFYAKHYFDQKAQMAAPAAAPAPTTAPKTGTGSKKPPGH